MSLIDSTAASLEDDPPGGASASSSTAPSVWYTLDPFTIRLQEETLWCWSAAAVSVSHFFNALSLWDQCSLVDKVLGRADCCGNPRPADCNQEHNLTDPLRHVGHYKGRSGAAWTLPQIRAIIDDTRPLGVRVEWPDTKRGHFILVTGYSDSDEVQVHDPDPSEGGMARLDYDTLKTNYTVAGGSWTHSYETRR